MNGEEWHISVRVVPNLSWGLQKIAKVVNKTKQNMVVVDYS